MSDHDPQDVETKRLPFAEAAPGAIGIETMLAASLRLVHSGDIALPVLLKAMSTRPAELLGLAGRHAAARQPGRRRGVRPRRAVGARSAPSSSRSARTPRSTRRGCRAAWSAPSSPAARSTNSCEALCPLPLAGEGWGGLFPRQLRVSDRHSAGCSDRALGISCQRAWRPPRPSPASGRGRSASARISFHNLCKDSPRL